MLSIRFSDLRARLLALGVAAFLGCASACFFAATAYASTVGDFDLALADGSDPQEGVDYTWTDDETQGGTLTIVSETSMIVANADGIKTTKDHIAVDVGEGKTAHLRFDGVKIETPNVNSGFPHFNQITVNPFLIKSGALNLTLEEGSENILKSNSTDAAGIQNIENPLVIDGSGKLVAEGGRNSAGIGGVAWKSGGNITIRGSVEIDAKGGDPRGTHGGGAGIGAGGSGGASNILICENAVVHATGGKGAAGIGASAFASARNIEITGNVFVAATGVSGDWGYADIGSPSGSVSNVVVSGGRLELANGRIGSESGTEGVSFEGGLVSTESYQAPSEDHPRGTVYGAEVADGHIVVANDDPETKDSYPYAIVNPTGDFLVTGGVYGTTHVFEDGVLTVTANADVTVSMASGIQKTRNRIVMNPGLGESAAVALSGIVIEYPDDNRSCGIEIASGDCAIILAADSENEVSRGGGPAMLIDAGASLSVEGDGALKVAGVDSNAAGIGVMNDAELVVNSGTIEAISNGGHAGIGDYDGGSVVINGGTVRAHGGHHVSWNAYDGAGIGGAWNNSGCDVTISGGTVTAVGGGAAAGIGGGYYRGYNGKVYGNSGGSIAITGGYVSASNGDRSASIGASSGASQDANSPIVISGGAFASGSTVGSGNVYGIAPADGRVVKSNNDEEEGLASSYPYRVYLAQEATLVFADSFEGGTYDASPIESEGLLASASWGSHDASGDVSFAYRIAGSEGAWTDGLPTDAGTYQIKASLPEAALGETYYPSTEVMAQAELVISAAPLFASLVEPAGIVFGDDAPSSASYMLSVSGWQGDDEGLLLPTLEAAISVSSGYEKGDDAGSYPVTVGWANDAPETLCNYKVSFAGTSLPVAKAAIASVSIADPSKKFDGAAAAEPGVVAIDGNGHESDGACSFVWYASDGQGGWTLLESAPSKVGTYKVVASIAEGTNHLTGTGELEFSIARADAKTVTVSQMASSKVYDGNVVETPAVDLGGYDGEVVFAWYESDGEGGWSEVASAPVDAGSYRLVVSAEQSDTQEAPIIVNGTQDFAILRAEQSADELEGVTASPEATSGGGDGTITGLPSGSEWRAVSAGVGRSGGDAWTAAPEDGTLGGLTPGIYEVRMAGDSNHSPSASVEVKVKSFSEAHGGITFPDGTVDSGDGSAVLPSEGGEVVFPGGEAVVLPGGTTVDPDSPSATTPSGSVVQPDGEGSLSVGLPGGVGTVTVPSGSEVCEDGSVMVSGGGVVLPNGSTAESEGEIAVGADGSVQIPDGGKVVLPGGTEVSSDDPIEIGTDGTVLLPDGGSVTRPDGTTFDVGAGTTVSVDGTVNDPTASGPSDGSGDSEGGSGGDSDSLGDGSGDSAGEDGSDSVDDQDGPKGDSNDRGAFAKTGDGMGVVFGALSVCAIIAVIAGFTALRKIRG